MDLDLLIYFYKLVVSALSILFSWEIIILLISTPFSLKIKTINN